MRRLERNRRGLRQLPDTHALLRRDVQLLSGIDVEGCVPRIDVPDHPVCAELPGLALPLPMLFVALTVVLSVFFIQWNVLGWRLG